MRLRKKINRLTKIYGNYRKAVARPDTMPVRLWIETSALCNLSCVMCPNKDLLADKKGLMDFGLFTRVIDQAKDFCNDVYLHHRGESLMHPEFCAMVRYAKTAGLKVRLHTNGTLLDKQKSGALISAQPDLVVISFDGYDKQTHERVRVGSEFEKTMMNVLTFLEIKKQSRRTLPYVIIEQIDFGNDADRRKQQDFKKLLRQKGADEVITKKLYAWVTPDAKDIVTATSAKCTFPWYAMVICYDGTVTACPQDFFTGIIVGNAAEQSLQEIWQGEEYAKLREKFKKDFQRLALCKKCDRLTRKKVVGIPWQYALTFVNDFIFGYGRMRKVLGSFERN